MSAVICADLGRVLSTGACAAPGWVVPAGIYAAPECVLYSRACAAPDCGLSAGALAAPECVLSAGSCSGPDCGLSARACAAHVVLDDSVIREPFCLHEYVKLHVFQAISKIQIFLSVFGYKNKSLISTTFSLLFHAS